jgi:YD repeat-containing protein
MSHKKFDFRTAYIDLLINLLTGTVFLFILTALLIAPITKQSEGIKKNADYIITMEWPENVDCDVDMWVRDPQNNIVSYKMPEYGLMYYERDDMGQRRSIFNIDGNKTIIDPDNKEYVTLRGTFPGEYVVNVHLYSCKAANEQKGLAINYPVNIPVVVELMKINPSIVSVKKVVLTMTQVWQEQTAFRFVMGNNKNIIRLMTDYVPIMGEQQR